MNLQRDDIKGWIGSIAFHLVLLIVLFLWHVDVLVGEPEFIEVTWGTIAAAPSTTTPRPRMPGSEGVRVSAVKPQSRTMDLPERQFPSAAEEVLRVPESRKLEVDEKPERIPVQMAENSRGLQEKGLGVGMGDKDRQVTPGMGDLAGEALDLRATAASGTDVGQGVSVSMQWSDGGTRKKLSGDLPTYPEGVNVEAQIRIAAVVQPDGSVKSLQPVQKAHTKLEEAAMAQVRFWTFEPLPRSLPQLDQTCMITFNFKLK